MTQSMVVGIMRDAFVMVLLIAGPIMAVALIVGLIISIIQATTQIQEQTLTFVPKIFTVVFFLLLMMPFILGKMRDYTEGIFESMANIVR